jgi:hypothetical protein
LPLRRPLADRNELVGQLLLVTAVPQIERFAVAIKLFFVAARMSRHASAAKQVWKGRVKWSERAI